MDRITYCQHDYVRGDRFRPSFLSRYTIDLTKHFEDFYLSVVKHPSRAESVIHILCSMYLSQKSNYSFNITLAPDYTNIVIKQFDIIVLMSSGKQIRHFIKISWKYRLNIVGNKHCMLRVSAYKAKSGGSTLYQVTSGSR